MFHRVPMRGQPSAVLRAQPGMGYVARAPSPACLWVAQRFSAAIQAPESKSALAAEVRIQKL
ncbi:MAG: hypothetical protein ACYDDS_12495 [Candidatus Sulfotelmatobacter sp.]